MNGGILHGISSNIWNLLMPVVVARADAMTNFTLDKTFVTVAGVFAGDGETILE